MTTAQFQILVEMFNTLSQRIDDVRTELKQDMQQLRADMDTGFAHQEAISHEILNTMGRAHAALEADFRATKTAHAKRLTRLEKRLS